MGLNSAIRPRGSAPLNPLKGLGTAKKLPVEADPDGTQNKPIPMSIPGCISSWIAAILCWILASVLTIFILGGLRDRARLLRDNDNERILSTLFTDLRGYDDFGSAIESNITLKERIVGFALYGDDLTLSYRWGTAPLVFDEKMLEQQVKSRFGRYTIPDKKGYRVKFVLHTGRMCPPLSLPMHRYNEMERQRHPRQDFFSFNSHDLASEKYLYIDVAHPAYWRTQTFTGILFLFCELALLIAVFYIRRLYLRNHEYRDRIEAQKNLVVLGTAASTLAHEIKNPLLSIRIQTGILRKIFLDKGQDEIRIIDEEVERISALIYRVNDYLREAEGNRVPINSYTILAETSQRLCGSNIIQKDSPRELMIYMDPCRARSVFENVLRNALESGSDAAAIGVSITRSSGSVLISVFDHGRGISELDLRRVFDPFFTRKSTGTGIGLSISKRFVEAVKGSIKLEHRECGGTLVEISLPEWRPSMMKEEQEWAY